MKHYVTKQFKTREFVKMVKLNGYTYLRTSGDHDIYFNPCRIGDAQHISIPTGKSDINIMLGRRLIKEYELSWK